MELRDAIKYLRTDIGLTQMELANALHINFSTVSRWETGKTTPNRAMATALMEVAKARAASDKCVRILKQAISAAAKGKMDASGNKLYPIEHASLRELIDEASFPLYVCDMETDEVLYANAKAEEMIGGSLDEIPNRKCYACIMHADQPCDFCHKSELVTDHFTCYEAVRAYDGRIYQVQGKRIQWNGRDAQVRYVTSNDSSNQLKAVIENMNGGVSVVVFSDDGAVRLAYANEKYYALFGYTKEQFLSELKDPHETIFPEDAAYVGAMIENVKKTRQAATFRCRVYRRDKSMIYMRCSASVASIEGLGENVLMSVLADVTASVQAEQEALIFGQRFKAIIGSINNGVAASIQRENGTIDYVFVTDRYYEMLGFSREQYHQEVPDPFSLIYDEDVDQVRSKIAPIQHIGDSVELRYRAVRRDGKMIWLEVNVSMLAFADVESPVQLSVFTDITHMVHANEQLEAQHKRISDMMNTTPGGIAVIEVNPNDVGGSLRTTYYNDRFFSYSGYTREEYDALLRGDEMHFVFSEDVPLLLDTTAKICRSKAGETFDVSVRCHIKDGGYRWLLLTGQLAQRRGDLCIINIVLVDITKRKIAEDRQRISEEMLRIAAETDKRALITYDVKANICRVESRNLYSAAFGETIANIPETLINRGIIAQESVDELISLFARIRGGEERITTSLQMRTSENTYQWFECNASLVLDVDGRPDQAVLVFHDITEQRVKEAVFKKWQNSIETRPASSYTLFRSNLSHETCLEERDGELLKIEFSQNAMSFNQRTKEYVARFVHPEDQQDYAALLNSEALLAMFYRGEHTATMEYREIGANGEVLWRRLTVEMVEYLNSTDIQAFLMYEDIDDKKKAELRERELAEKDPLTGVLNRATFSEMADVFLDNEANAQHALLMLDMDGFKLLNDTFGHAAGDQALMDITAVLRAMTRDSDLVGRLGGDEFLVFLRNIPYDAVIGKIAQQICEQVRKAFSLEVQISASVGVAVYPRDGRSFDELYRNADKALYKVKQSGKDDYAFYSVTDEDSEMASAEPSVETKQSVKAEPKTKRRMLIVDDNETCRITLKSLFQDEYLVETAKSGMEAMIRLRHFGSAISVVLLDLIMPGVDGFSVLKKMQANVDLRTIPVIVVSSDENRQTLLKAIECGAADFVTKPVDVDLIRLRVQSAVSKAENERLRAQNSYLQLQQDEELKYHTVLESTGTVVIEYDWRNHVFIYDSTISNYIAGNYNHRGLWQIFLSDMVADCADVKLLQEVLLFLANNRDEHKASKLIMLKTPSKAKHWFRMNVYKHEDAYGLAEKMIITFNDVHEEILADERLRFQATRDALTGLYNRAGFIERASELIAKQDPGYYVMACIDIGKFKVINDQYGTKKGDEVLCNFAQALQNILTRYGAEESICCRVMADNFAALYPKRILDCAGFAASHREVERLDGSLPPLKFYVGRCVVEDKSLDISAIYDRAAIAKDTVKGRYDVYVATYDEAMRRSILRQQEITGQMNDALINGQFEVWLQPQFNHATGQLSGAEALARWRHPKEGIISPVEFIPIFERNGFVYELDKFIWEQTCRLLRKWLDQGLQPVPVSVNISRYDVFRKDLSDVIKRLTQKYDLPRELLRLEITESAFTESSDQIIRVVKAFMELGFVVEIDDFGSGYSSLNTLKDVPAQVLKLDMRFLENDSNAQRGGSIIESVVRMARWLGMSVIAEGVETLAQADFLKSIGCENVQGFLYSRPIEVSEYEKLFEERGVEPKLRQLDTVATWNNNAFWNPNAIETLIFNSYVGGACIFEYQHGKTELLRYNDGFLEVFNGYLNDSHMTNHSDVFSILDAGNAAILKNNIETAMRTKRESSCESRLVRVDGSMLDVRSTVRQIAQAGERCLFYCVVADITAQRAAERGEREAASRIAAIMDNIDGGITAVSSKNGRPEMIFSNDRFYTQLGYTREQFAREVPTYFNAIHPQDRTAVWQKVHETLTYKTPCSMHYRCVKRDGSIIYIRSNIALCPIDGIEGDVMITVETDISELVKAQKNEQVAAEQIRAVMDNTTCGIAAVVLNKDGTTQRLLVNGKYFELVGYTREQYDALALTWRELMHPDDLAAYGKRIIDLDTVGQTASFEFRIKRRDGRWIWLRGDISVISLKGVDVPVQLSCYTDITQRKQADDRLRFVNELASEILSQSDNDRAIEYTLRRLMEYFHAERSYIVELDFAHGVAHNTYEVCAQGIKSQKAFLQDVTFSETDIWYTALTQRNFFRIKDVETLGDDGLRELLKAQDIRSLIFAPLWRDGRLVGFTGVDNPANMPDEMERLMAPADYLAILLTRRDLNRNIERGNAAMRQLINDTPGGFCRVAIHDGKNPTLASMNEGFCRMLDMTESEVWAAYGDDAFKCLAKEDVAFVIDNVQSDGADGGQLCTKCRLRKKNGDYLWVMIFGRYVRDEAGNAFLNAYFTDISAQRRADELRVSLLDNLTCGVALYEFDGKNISVIHINKNYWKLVGRDPVDYSEASVLDVIHPDDRATLQQEAAACIRQHRNFAADLRILNGKGTYIPFHVSATVEQKSNGKYLFYTAYMPISEQTMSIQEMLPIALSAIMSTSEDVTFIKDRDGRYVACSKSGLSTFGFASERDIIGKTNGELFGPARATAVANADEQVFQTGMPLLERVLKLPVSGGETRIFNVSEYPLLDGAGNVIGIYGVLRDVTRAHKNEFELNTMLHFIPSGILKYSADEKAEFAYINRNFVESLGYTEDGFREKFHNSFNEMVWAEDRANAEREIDRQETEGKIGKFDFRVEAADGKLHWLHDEGAQIIDESGKAWYYVTLVDISERKEAEEKLRLAEEEYRLAAAHSKATTCRYDIASKTITITSAAAKRLELPEIIENVPYGRVEQGRISSDTAQAYIDFYEGINHGNKQSSVVFKKRLPSGWRWIRAHATTLFSDGGEPVTAIISYVDATDEQEKEAAYKRWQQRLMDKGTDAYTLFRCNLSKDCSYDSTEGTLVTFHTDDDKAHTFNDRTKAFANQCVFSEDRKKYMEFMDSNKLLADYHRGKRTSELAFRGNLSSGVTHWLRLFVELVEYPNSTDVEAYLMYEDINDSMLENLQTKKEAETDPLTGLLNRNAFIEKLEQMLAAHVDDTLITLFMLDMDGFKLINDSFGHAAGDQALIGVGEAIRSVLRDHDLVCRLGGDEFLVALTDMPNRKSIITKAKQLCRLAHKAFNLDIRISISLGIAVSPDDGCTFEELYQKADKALYHVKEHGKDNCAFYSEELLQSPQTRIPQPAPFAGTSIAAVRRRMLIVEDSKTSRDVLEHIFKNDFRIDTVGNGRDALVFLRRFTTDIHVVLLDLMMPEMDGFAVLDKMRESTELQSIPVIVVSGLDDRETNLRVIQYGAADYVIKPVDPDLLRVRVASAISKAENERLRMLNQTLQTQRYESERVRSILEADGTVVVEYAHLSGSFQYESAMSRCLAGRFDDRPLWDILVEDNQMTRDEANLLRTMTEGVANHEKNVRSKAIFRLKTGAGEIHDFRIKVIPDAAQQDAGSNCLLVFTDINLFEG